jgi:hypothetical protein
MPTAVSGTTTESRACISDTRSNGRSRFTRRRDLHWRGSQCYVVHRLAAGGAYPRESDGGSVSAAVAYRESASGWDILRRPRSYVIRGDVVFGGLHLSALYGSSRGLLQNDHRQFGVVHYAIVANCSDGMQLRTLARSFARPSRPTSASRFTRLVSVRQSTGNGRPHDRGHVQSFRRGMPTDRRRITRPSCAD